MSKPRVAVFSPWCATGGVEALHQIAEALFRLGHETSMRYYDIGCSDVLYAGDTPRPEYRHYAIPVSLDDDYEWAIVPECRRDLVPLLHAIGKRVAFWHLGVGSWPENAPDLHLACGSHAVAWCREHGAEALVVSDYLGRDFFLSGSWSRSSTVYYGWRSSDKIEAIAKHIPLINFELLASMSSSEMASTMRRASVFLEAGGSGGLDRMPREAVACGATVVWYKTDPQFDVPPGDLTDSFESCAWRLLEVLEDSRSALKGQSAYRKWICDAETRFRAEVAALSERLS